MKIVTSDEMVRLEKLAYSSGLSEEEFMEKAGLGVAIRARQMVAEYHLTPKILFLCGKGNNGGDALVAARHLMRGGFEIEVMLLASQEEEISPLAKMESQRFVAAGGKIRWIKKEAEIGPLSAGLLVDGIFGTGFHGEATGVFSAAILQANSSRIPILSIDTPSGLDSQGRGTTVIQATETLFLGLPKWGCFLEGAWNFVGKVHVFNFGLPQEILDQAKSSYFLLERELVSSQLPPIYRERHKYSAGYVVGLGGSPGMAGAPLMASLAALRTGAGIVRLFHPEAMSAEFAAAALEIVRRPYHLENLEELQAACAKASALFIGPGLGLQAGSLKVVQQILPQVQKPCVLDAEALTLIAQNHLDVPRGAVVTPHRGEMQRLLQLTEKIEFPLFLKKCHQYAEEKGVTLVVKGAPTFIFHPGAPTAISSRGDPGMATAGMGDILTGIIASLLAQGKSTQEAAYLGVYLHGLAGEEAAKELTSYCMIATDILKFLPSAFKFLAKSD